jgi:glycyl-tRNA synthetase beta chain
MAEFFLELFCEEMPARMQPRACEDIVRLFTEQAKKADLTFDVCEAFASPRRLALHVGGLPTVQANTSEEVKGPRSDAPEAALAGFLKKTGLTKEQLEMRDDGKKGQIYFAVIKRDGRATISVLTDIIPTLIQNFPWPKSMRWGGQSTTMDSLRWVRPLQSIVALFQGEIVPVEIGGLKSGNITRGHRFMANSQFTVDDFEDYRGKLKRANVILDAQARMKIIDTEARALAAKAGLTLVEDAGLLAENAGLTEWPVVLMGEFDPAFLDVPAECLTATMRANQKYFSLNNPDGTLAPKFLCVANIAAKDKGKSIIAGNQKVLSSRLSDAKFFWDQDRKNSLESYLPKLAHIIFHEKLGTVADKVERIEKLSAALAEIIYPQLKPSGDRESFIRDVKRAAQLCKADLTTGMVSEFPELQGIMGRYYALKNGETEAVARAIEEHYKPQGPSDSVPTDPISVCVALADKMDTLTGFFAVNERPTGSRDPFALRRAALGILEIITLSKLRLTLDEFASMASAAYTVQWCTPGCDEATLTKNREAFSAEFYGALPDFFRERLKVQQRDAGVRHDLIDAIEDYDVVRLLARLQALQIFLGTENGVNLLAGYKRAANILKIEEKKDNTVYRADPEMAFSVEAHQAEVSLSALFQKGLYRDIEAHMKNEDFAAAMSALATLRAPVDAFFTDVKVNDDDPAVRIRRLNLLAGVRDVMHKVADFSKIEG